MKKLLVGTVAAISIISGATAIAHANSASSNPMVKMFAQFHDLSDYQQELVTELMASGKTLAKEVKKPKEQIRTYLTDMVEMETIDVEKVMVEVRAWQDDVEKQFEETLTVAAKLHANLTVEQRKKLVETFKSMRSRS